MAVQAVVATQSEKMNELLTGLKEGSRTFARLPIADRIQLLEEMRQGYRAVAEESVVAACRAKGIDPSSSLAGEEWLAGPTIVIRNLRLLVQGLRDVASVGAPRLKPSGMKTLPDGRLSVSVFPTNALDAVLLPKHTAEVHMQRGVTAQNIREHQASFYRKPHEGRLCVVLGAGNVNSIPPTDCAYKMFVEGKVCVLKMNPVNAYLGPFLERAFRTAVERGFFAVAYGGAEEGAYLINHPLVDEIHITGSDKTHDMMVWGPPGPERDVRKRMGEPILKKVITSELGNISPVVVVPGPYEEDELAFQASNIAGMIANNASFNCNSAKLLVSPRDWDKRGHMLDLVAKAVEKAPVRKAYYPGAEQRWKAFTQGRVGVRLIGKAGPGELPYALIANVDPSRQDMVFTQEPWCSILSETGLPGSDVVPFLKEAVQFLNQRVWGTLNATLIVHPRTLRDPAMAEAIEKAIRELEYGTVALNTWPAAGFALGSPPWGGHPSARLEDIQSGRGWVHNTFMLEDIEKCVLRAPVKSFPISPWFPEHRTLDQLGRKLVDFEMNPSWLKVPGIAAIAMRA
jgi:aldehyde dehydrogenase (NAD(P)+)